MTFAHLLGCAVPDIHVTRGVTRVLTTCRKCGAQEWGDLR